MTYTREQIVKAISDSIWLRVMSVRDSDIEPREANAAVLAMTSVGEQIFHEIDLLEPIDLEPTPAPKENADEKRTTYEHFDGMPRHLCSNCGDVRSAHLGASEYCPR